MELQELKEIRDAVGIQISKSLNEVGTDEMYELCSIQDRLNRLIQMKERPDKINKVIKSMNLGVKK